MSELSHNDFYRYSYDAGLALSTLLRKSNLRIKGDLSLMQFLRQGEGEDWENWLTTTQVYKSYIRGTSDKLTVEDASRNLTKIALQDFHEKYSPDRRKLIRCIIQFANIFMSDYYYDPLIPESYSELSEKLVREVKEKCNRVIEDSHWRTVSDSDPEVGYNSSFERYPSVHHESKFNAGTDIESIKEKIEDIKEDARYVIGKAHMLAPRRREGDQMTMPTFDKDSVVQYDFFIDWELSKAELMEQFGYWLEDRIPEKYSGEGESLDSFKFEQKVKIRRKGRDGFKRYIEDFMFWYVECYGVSSKEKFESYQARFKDDSDKVDRSLKAIAKSASNGLKYIETGLLAYPHLEKNGDIILPEEGMVENRNHCLDELEGDIMNFDVDHEAMKQ